MEIFMYNIFVKITIHLDFVFISKRKERVYE